MRLVYTVISLSIFMLFLALPTLAQESYVTNEGLHEILLGYVNEDDPSVVVVVYDDGETYSAAYGLADLERGVKATEHDLYRIGSITKPMVATIMLDLVETEVIGLDDPIADYLPTNLVENIENADSATIRQVLQMTSGIVDYTITDAFDDAVEKSPQTFWTAEDTLTFIYGEPASFDPDEGYEYSNTNYIIAQIIIERVTGQPLADTLREKIFTPLGMETCYLETAATFAQFIVRGYSVNEDSEWVDVTEYNDGVGLGDGGVICTASDLVNFPIGLYHDDLISESAFDEMTTTVEDEMGEPYGLGIVYEEDGELGEYLGHDGATSGFQSSLFYLPDERLGVALLTNNFDSEILEDITDEVLALAYGE